MKYNNWEGDLIPLDMAKVKYIVLHHIDAVKAEPEQIHKWHLKNGWRGFGYNEYIRKDGTLVVGRGYNIGAQCKGWNSQSYGIALEGKFSIEEPTREQIITLHESIDFLKIRFPNLEGIKNHYELVNTECPAINLVEFLNEFDYDFYKILMRCKARGVINSEMYWFNKVDLTKDFYALVNPEYLRKLFENISDIL
jgi:hypothetical protein